MPFGLDGAAMFCSVLAVREASHGDAALGSRMLVWTFAGAAAWFNWVHAPRGLGHAGAPQFFAGMSLSAAVLFDRALKQTRRAALREQGLVPRPLPQIRIVRWLRAPRETFAAWSLMLLEGVRTLDEAVEEVREDRREREQNRHRRREQGKLDRARIKAINRQHRTWGIGRGGGRQLPVPQPVAAEVVGADPAIAGAPQPLLTGELSVPSRPALKAVSGAEAEGVGVPAGTRGPWISPPRTTPRRFPVWTPLRRNWPRSNGNSADRWRTAPTDAPAHGSGRSAAQLEPHALPEALGAYPPCVG